jgi:hypothetical protein
VHNNCLRLVAPDRVVKSALGLLQASQKERGYRIELRRSIEPEAAADNMALEVGEPGLEAL